MANDAIMIQKVNIYNKNIFIKKLILSIKKVLLELFGEFIMFHLRIFLIFLKNLILIYANPPFNINGSKKQTIFCIFQIKKLKKKLTKALMLGLILKLNKY